MATPQPSCALIRSLPDRSLKRSQSRNLRRTCGETSASAVRFGGSHGGRRTEPFSC